jgi:hypothetical protein
MRIVEEYSGVFASIVEQCEGMWSKYFVEKMLITCSGYD